MSNNFHYIAIIWANSLTLWVISWTIIMEKLKCFVNLYNVKGEVFYEKKKSNRR